MDQRITESFARQSFLATFDARLQSIRPGAVDITAPIGPNTLQQQGFSHAGLAFALGDSAAGYSALTLMPDDQEVVTVEMKINLLAPGMGAALVARGRVIKPGKRLMIVGADVYAVAEDQSETHIAILQGTMIPRNATRP